MAPATLARTHRPARRPLIGEQPIVPAAPDWDDAAGGWAHRHRLAAGGAA
ncbi:hypothetical protein ACQP60_18840 [Isoptericola variabilis]